jgi:hypothetical protein
MKDSDSKKPKKKEPQIDFTNITADDIARRFLESPPKPKKIKSKESKE